MKKPNRPVVMIIEDDQAMESMLCEFLESQGYACVPQRWAAKALEALKKQHPDLIISDLNMPEMGGLEFVETIRARGLSVPVLVLTAFGSKGGYEASIKAGANSYLTKPFPLAVLLTEVKKLVEPAA